MFLYPIRGPPVNTAAEDIRVFAYGTPTGSGERFDAPLFRLLCLHLRPSCLNSFACAFASLFWRKGGGSCFAAFLCSKATESNSGRVLSFCHEFDYTCSGRNSQLDNTCSGTYNNSVVSERMNK